MVLVWLLLLLYKVKKYVSLSSLCICVYMRVYVFFSVVSQELVLHIKLMSDNSRAIVIFSYHSFLFKIFSIYYPNLLQILKPLLKNIYLYFLYFFLFLWLLVSCSALMQICTKKRKESSSINFHIKEKNM